MCKNAQKNTRLFGGVGGGVLVGDFVAFFVGALVGGLVGGLVGTEGTEAGGGSGEVGAERVEGGYNFGYAEDVGERYIDVGVCRIETAQGQGVDVVVIWGVDVGVIWGVDVVGIWGAVGGLLV